MKLNIISAFTNTRYYFLLLVLISLGLLGFGLYLEHMVGLEPCPLCVFQRIAFIAIFCIAVVAAIHGPLYRGKYLYNGLLLITAIIGGSIAARQVWLQHLPPDQVPECGPGLDYMLDAFPLADAVRMILSGSGECAEIQWQFLGLSIAEWSLFWFFIISISALISIFTVRQTIRSTNGNSRGQYS